MDAELRALKDRLERREDFEVLADDSLVEDVLRDLGVELGE